MGKRIIRDNQAETSVSPFFGFFGTPVNSDGTVTEKDGYILLSSLQDHMQASLSFDYDDSELVSRLEGLEDSPVLTVDNLADIASISDLAADISALRTDFDNLPITDWVTASELASSQEAQDSIVSNVSNRVDVLEAAALSSDQINDINYIDTLSSDLSVLGADFAALPVSDWVTVAELIASQDAQDLFAASLSGRLNALEALPSLNADQVADINSIDTISSNLSALQSEFDGLPTDDWVTNADLSASQDTQDARLDSLETQVASLLGTVTSQAALITALTTRVEVLEGTGGAPVITFNTIPDVTVSVGDTFANLSLSATASDGSTVTFELEPDPTPNYTLSGNTLTRDAAWDTAGTDAVVVRASSPGADAVDQQVNIIIEAVSDYASDVPNELDGSGLAPGESAPGSYASGSIEFTEADFTNSLGDTLDGNQLQINSDLRGTFAEMNVTATNGAPVKTTIDISNRFTSDPRAVQVDAYNDNGVIRFMVPQSGVVVDTHDGTGIALESADVYVPITEAPVYTDFQESEAIVRGHNGSYYPAQITLTFSADGCTNVVLPAMTLRFYEPSASVSNIQTIGTVDYDVTTLEGRQARAFFPPDDVVLADESDITNDPSVIDFNAPRFGISYEDDSHTNTGFSISLTGSNSGDFTYANRTTGKGLTVFENPDGLNVLFAHGYLHWLVRPAVGSYTIGIQYEDDSGNTCRTRATLVVRDANPSMSIDTKLVLADPGTGTRSTVASASDHFTGVEIQTQPGGTGGVGTFYNNIAMASYDLLNSYGAVETVERAYRRHMLDVNQHGYPLIPDDASDFGAGQALASQFIVRADRSPTSGKIAALTGEYTMAISNGEVFARTDTGIEIKGTIFNDANNVTRYVDTYDPSTDGDNVQFIYNQSNADTKDLFFGLSSEYSRWQNGEYTNLAVSDAFNFGSVIRFMTLAGITSAQPLALDAADADSKNNRYEPSPQRSLYDLPDINGFTYDNNFCQRGRGKFNQVGLPIEVQLQVARETGNTLHLCIPHQFTDDGIREICDRIKAQIPRGQRIIIEYSNEVWNGSSFYALCKFHSLSSWIAKGLADNVYTLTNGVPNDQSAFDVWTSLGWMKWAGYQTRRWYKIMDAELPDHNVVYGLGVHSGSMPNYDSDNTNPTYDTLLEGWSLHATEEGLDAVQTATELQENTMALINGYTFFMDNPRSQFVTDSVPNLALLSQSQFNTLFYDYWTNTTLAQDDATFKMPGSFLAGHTIQVDAVQRTANSYGFTTAMGEYEGGPHTEWSKVTSNVLAAGGCTSAEKDTVDGLFEGFTKSVEYGQIETDLLNMYASKGVSIKSLYNTTDEPSGTFPYAYNSGTLLNNEAEPRLKAHTDWLGMTGITQI